MKSNILKWTLILFSIIVAVAGTGAFMLYQKIFTNNVSDSVNGAYYLFISSDGKYEDVIDSLEKHSVLNDMISFKWVASRKKYPEKVKAGRYEILPRMSNNEILNMLRIGKQKPIKLTFNNIRTKLELAKKISDQLEFDSLSLIELLNDKAYLKEFGFNPESVISMFIPNTYEMNWNKTPQQFFEKMNKEYKKFWNDSRESKRKKLNLSHLEISTLASIVQAEQAVKNDEKPRVSGLYINRIHQRMALESCATLIYAMGDFTIRRVLNRDLEFDSPYNTYKYAGLPPGPINLPEISSIDAVLNYEKNDYIFMCAKDDFSGYHYFSTNLSQHNIYARRYQMVLDRKGIKR